MPKIFDTILTWNNRSVGGAEAVWQLTGGPVASGGAVGVLAHGAGVLIGAVGAVGLLVAEQDLVQTLTGATL